MNREQVEGRLGRIKVGPEMSRKICELAGSAPSEGAFSGTPLPVVLVVAKAAFGTTRELVAGERECRAASEILDIPMRTAAGAFKGRPAKQMVEMCRWALRNETKEEFDAETALEEWSEKQRQKDWAKEVQQRAKEAV